VNSAQNMLTLNAERTGWIAKRRNLLRRDFAHG
jgi:hypothetical protein